MIFKFPQRIFCLKGMTLTEILVATMLVAIVMLGAVSVDYAVRNARKSASQDASLTMRTQATMLLISRDANAAVGDASDPGIVDSPAVGALCIRKEKGGDINTYSDDEWTCYWQNGTNIYRCLKDIATGPTQCNTGDPVVGTASVDCPNGGLCFKYDFVFNEITKEIYLDIAITTRSKPSAAADPINNPEYTASTHISPSGHGF